MPESAAFSNEFEQLDVVLAQSLLCLTNEEGPRQPSDYSVLVGVTSKPSSSLSIEVVER